MGFSFFLFFILWESRCEDCDLDTLVQCVACLLAFLAVLYRDGEGRGVQFDSDYSGGEGASPFNFLRVSGGFSLCVLVGWGVPWGFGILLICACEGRWRCRRGGGG